MPTPDRRQISVLLFLFLFAAARGGMLRAQDQTALEEEAIKNAVRLVAPSVVRIETLGGLERVGRLLVGTGPTTGLIISADGLLVSSAFNFVQLPASILVTLPDGKRRAAKIIARDQSRKLVFLKVETDQELTVPKLAMRQEMQVGQWAIAVGRTLSDENPNVSVGILSARNRIWGKAIQTDAKISPSNYGGPLVDIQGRVMGILVPLSPQQQGEVAGAEWYDSGIGFAIPLEEVFQRLDKLKQGQDLLPGLLGIALKGRDIYEGAVVITSVRVNSPAYHAGLKAGDEIVEANGREITRQAQLKHVLGALYAGDKVNLVVKRKDERIAKEIELTDKLLPFLHPFLGILPRRDASENQGLVVRHVFPGSPAAEVDIKAGDELLALAGKPLTGLESAHEALAALKPEDKLAVSLLRGEEKMEKTVVLSKVATEIPDSLPPAHGEPKGPAAGDQPALRLVQVEIPEQSNKCFAYVPSTYRSDTPHGLVVYLHPSGGLQEQELIEQWKELCEQHDLILLAPQAANPKQWMPTETEFIGKVIDNVTTNYNVDPARIVAQGFQAGGAMALLTAFNHRDVIRGVVAVDANVPGRIQEPDNDPINRLALLFVSAKESAMAARVKRDQERLASLGFPVTLLADEGKAQAPTKEQLLLIVRWIDSLDRI